MSGRDTSFYYSFLVLPAEKRGAIVTVWDFCRAVDDAVDEVPEGQGAGARSLAEERVAAWRKELAACYGESSPATGQGRRLVPFIERFNLPRDAFERVIDGVAMDLDRSRYETFDELREYCLRVASAVGLICLEIFGYRNPRTRDYAVDLGIALQLTNIVRDVRTDLERGRVYLPQEDLRRFGCSEADLAAGKMTPGARALLAFECERAQGYYERAERELPREDRRAMVAARIMGGIYHAILSRIVRSGYDVFREKVRVPRPQRAAIAAAIWAKAMVGL